jgi:hypothetical protein
MKKKAGSAIAYGLIIIAALTIIIVGIMQLISTHIKYGYYVADKEKAFHIAESGIYFYRWYLAHEIEQKNQDEINTFWVSNPIGVANPYVKDYLDNNGEKIGEAEINVTFPVSGNYNVVEINSTGHTLKNLATRSVRATLRRSIWSDFAVISDSLVCFDKYWTINGKVMGNNGVHFDGVANNIVMSGVGSYNDTNPLHTTYNGKDGVWTSWAYDNGHNCYYNTEKNSCVFMAGSKYPVPKKDFSGVTSSLQALKSKAQAPSGTTLNNCTSTGCYFDNSSQGRRIILKSNGTFDMCPVSDYWTNNGTNQHYPKKYQKVSGSGTCNDCSGACLATYNIPSSGPIFVENNVWLEGTISNKKVTIVAASITDPANNANIFLMNNVKYTSYTGSDIMGIVAEGDIEILKNTPNDLKIDGALLAQNGAVTKPEYNPDCCGSGCTNNKNYINIYGCVVTKNGLNFSLHKETCPGLILERVITYDNNLYLYPPPYFPADSFYYVDTWEEL